MNKRIPIRLWLFPMISPRLAPRHHQDQMVPGPRSSDTSGCSWPPHRAFPRDAGSRLWKRVTINKTLTGSQGLECQQHNSARTSREKTHPATAPTWKSVSTHFLLIQPFPGTAGEPLRWRSHRASGLLFWLYSLTSCGFSCVISTVVLLLPRSAAGLI